MVCGLFSSFDPGVMSGMGVKWVYGLTVMLIGWKVYVLPVGSELYLSKMVSLIWESVKAFASKSAFLLLISIFFMVLLMNVGGLLPYFMPLTSHLVVNLSLSVPLWLGGMTYALLLNLEKTVAHLLPLGSPAFLWPLLVCVETVSLMIRPLTLGVRLMANVMAGHLIMSLVGSMFSSLWVVFPVSWAMMMGLVGFELGVALVQSYVFVSLMALYWDKS